MTPAITEKQHQAILNGKGKMEYIICTAAYFAPVKPKFDGHYHPWSSQLLNGCEPAWSYLGHNTPKVWRQLMSARGSN
jgi:hypothetical protein